jgi:aspartate racemase
MARVGLIGGLGPESTVDYYRRIIQVWQETDPGSAPSVIIDSLDVDLGIRLVQNDRDGLVEYLSAAAERLQAAGADFAAMAANTPHVVFDELTARTSIPLVSIVEVCAREAVRLHVRAVGLLGTRFTMEAPFYRDVFARHSIAVHVPGASDRSWLHERYIGELLRGDFRQETRDGVATLVRGLRSAHRVDAVVLGGTELPLLMDTDSIDGVPLLDTTELHVRAIVARLQADAHDQGS